MVFFFCSNCRYRSSSRSTVNRNLGVVSLKTLFWVPNTAIP